MPEMRIANTVPTVGISSRRTHSAGAVTTYDDENIQYNGASTYYEADVVWTDLATPAFVRITNTVPIVRITNP